MVAATTLTGRAVAIGTTARIIPRGDAHTITYTLGADYDLTDKLVYVCAKARKTATTAIVNRAATITSVPLRTVSITLTPAETAVVGTYHAEVELRELNDTAPQTARMETWIIAQDVRQ